MCTCRISCTVSMASAATLPATFLAAAATAPTRWLKLPHIGPTKCGGITESDQNIFLKAAPLSMALLDPCCAVLSLMNLGLYVAIRGLPYLSTTRGGR